MYRYDSANYLVSGVDLPATAQITSATPSRPFICLKLELQPAIVYDILQETTRGAGRMTQKTSALIYVDGVTQLCAMPSTDCSVRSTTRTILASWHHSS